MNEPSVSVRNLTKSFSGRAVVDDLSFDVQKGEVFALLGHNGAGKSTTIDLILGLKTPDGERQKLSVVLALIGSPEIVFPAGLRAVSGWMPLGLGIKLLKSVSAGCYDNIVMPVATLTAIAVIRGAVAVKTFRWE